MIGLLLSFREETLNQSLYKLLHLEWHKEALAVKGDASSYEDELAREHVFTLWPLVSPSSPLGKGSGRVQLLSKRGA